MRRFRQLVSCYCTRANRRVRVQLGRLKPSRQIIDVMARSAWWLAILIAFCRWLPAVTLANEFEQTHSGDIEKMVAASVKMETGWKAIEDDFRRKAALEPHSPAIRAEGKLNFQCYSFIHARFYTKYRALIDNIDTHSIFSPAYLRKNNSDASILHDPQKIAYETKYIISSFEHEKDFHPPVEEFAVQYAARPEMETACVHYLDVTGMRD